MKHPLDSARERLKRANENIANLERELTEFLKDIPSIPWHGEKPVWSNQDRNAFNKIGESFKNRTVDPRFSVLTGEIIHHLRSAFDHVAWQLSSDDRRLQSPTSIEFPVFDKDPRGDKDKLHKYQRKIKGITSASALTIIERMQPYNGLEPRRSALWLIHHMDAIDKHRELVIVVQALTVNIRSNIQLFGMAELRPHDTRPPKFIGPMLPLNIEYWGEVSAQIAFRELGKGEPEPVIPVLKQLSDFARDAVELFSREF